MVLVMGTIRARAVHDDSDGFVGMALVVVINGAVGVQELVGDVGQDGGAARGDMALGDLDEEIGEEFVDGDGRLEVGEFADELGGEIDGVGRGGLRLGMAETETGARVHDGKLAPATAVGVMTATGAFAGAWIGGLVVHFRFLDWGDRGYTPPWRWKESGSVSIQRGCGRPLRRRVRKKQKRKRLDVNKGQFVIGDR